jgi:hypothetical protein
MTASLLQFIEHLLGDQIGPFAKLLHALVLAIVVIAWALPFFLTTLREFYREGVSFWVPMWHCAHCGGYSPPDYVECQACRKPMRPPWWARFLPEMAVQSARHAGKFLLSTYRIAGMVIFYAVTLLAFWNLRFYSFAQYPLQEILASAVMLSVLLTMSFLGRAFNAKLESHAARLADPTAAGLFAAVWFGTGFLWACSPFPPEKPLAYVQSLGDGRVRLMSPGGLQALAMGVSDGGGLKFQVQYAELTWPMFNIRQPFILRLSEEPVMDPVTLLFFDGVAPSLAREGHFRPRLSVMNQVFQVAPGASYQLREPRQGAGLLLEEKA